MTMNFEFEKHRPNNCKETKRKEKQREGKEIMLSNI